MNFIQIHFGKKPLERMSFIKKQINNLNDDDSYTLVSSSNFLSRYMKVNWIDVEDVKKEMFKIYSEIEERWNCFNVVKHSNFIRLYMATYIEDMFYVDTDAYIKEVPEFEDKTKPYISFYNVMKPNIGIFYNNNCFDFFRNYFEFIKLTIKESSCKYLSSGDFFRATIRKYCKHVNQCNQLDDKYFVHALMGRQERK